MINLDFEELEFQRETGANDPVLQQQGALGEEVHSHSPRGWLICSPQDKLTTEARSALREHPDLHHELAKRGRKSLIESFSK